MKRSVTILFIMICITVITICLFKNNYLKEIDSNSNDKNITEKSEIYYEITRTTDYIAISLKDLYEMSDLVIIGKKIKTNKVFVGDNGFPITETNYEIEDVLKGNKTEDTIDINYYGGIVTLEEYIKKLTKDQLKKKNLDNISLEDQKNKLVSYKKNKTSVDEQEVNSKYLILLGYDKSKDMYFVLADGYGMRELDKNGKAYNLDTNNFENIEFN